MVLFFEPSKARNFGQYVPYCPYMRARNISVKSYDTRISPLSSERTVALIFVMLEKAKRVVKRMTIPPLPPERLLASEETFSSR